MAVSPSISEDSAKKTNREIREWAIGEGRDVSSRGRIRAEIVHAFYDGQAKKIQAEKAAAKKTTVKKTAVKKAAVNKTAPKKTATKKAAAKKVVAAKAPAVQAMTKEIREWAIGEGREVSSRGRIPSEIVHAFNDAQGKKVQAKVRTAPAKKKAAVKSAPTKAAVTTAPMKKAAAVAKKAAVRKTAAEKTAVTRTPASEAAVRKTTAEIRAWAIGEGREVSSRGWVSAEVERAFYDARAQKVQAGTATANKVTTKKVTTKNAAAKSASVKKAAAVSTKAPVKKKTATTPAAEKTAKGTPTSDAPVRRTAKEIREWAVGEGREVSSRGRVSAEIERAFYDAQAKMSAA
jgi:hypothetical protein